MDNNIKETLNAGGVVFNNKGEVVVVSQRSDSWSLPKGHIDEGEDALTAAKREIYEESGIKNLELIRDLGTYERYRIGKNGEGEDVSERKIIHMFLFKTEEDLLRPVDPDNPEARWIKKENVADLLTHVKDKEFFLTVIQTL